MRRVLERCAALDVHKKQVTACARIFGEGGELEELTVELSTMADDLLAMRDWLKQLGVTHVAMEATGVYWKPVYYVLEDDFDLLLVNAQHVKNVYKQIKRRRGHNKAIVAVAHSILIAAYHILKTKSPTTTSAATATPRAPTPTGSPSASSRNLNDSAIASPSKRR